MVVQCIARATASPPWPVYTDRAAVLTAPAGNIQNLTRRGRIDPDMSLGNPVYDVIDNLSYTYGAGSRLDAVADAANANFGFKNNSQYIYDAAGNLISDSGKGLDIDYNPLNLPRAVNGPSTDDLELDYFAGGGLYRRATTGSSPATRYYVAGLEVVDGQLEQYHFGNGRVAFEANGTPRFQ